MRRQHQTCISDMMFQKRQCRLLSKIQQRHPNLLMITPLKTILKVSQLKKEKLIHHHWPLKLRNWRSQMLHKHIHGIMFTLHSIFLIKKQKSNSMLASNCSNGTKKRKTNQEILSSLHWMMRYHLFWITPSSITKTDFPKWRKCQLEAAGW